MGKRSAERARPQYPKWGRDNGKSDGRRSALRQKNGEKGVAGVKERKEMGGYKSAARDYNCTIDIGKSLVYVSPSI